VEQRVTRLEERMNKLEDKFEKHGVEFAETRVYVKEIYKKLDDLNISIAAINQKGSESNNDRWARIVERSFWAIVTIVGYFLGKGI
jgi:DNA repair ATPase RecN